MRVLCESEVPIDPTEFVFREERFGKGVWFLIFFAITVTGLIAWLWPGVLPFSGEGRVVAIVLLPIFALLAWVAWSMLRHSYSRANWLVRQRGGVMFVKFRSYLNRHFDPADAVVIEIPRSDVRWIRKHREKRRIERGNATHTEHLAFLDVGLDLPERDLQRLGDALREEVVREGPMRYRMRHKSKHHPVRLMPDSVLRLEWKVKSSSIRPRLDEALELLGRDFDAGDGSSFDSTADPEARHATEEQILDLISRGDSITAMTLAREHYGFSLTEAHRFVTELEAKC